MTERADINLLSAVGEFARWAFGKSFLALTVLLLVLLGLASPSTRVRMVTTLAVIACMVIAWLRH